MSVPHTFLAQRRRFSELGIRTLVSRRLRDVDRYDDALAVAVEAPRTHFAACLRDLAALPVL